MNDQKEEIIKQLEERLKWYTHEASAEEFDEEEVYIITQLLQKLRKEDEDVYFNPEDSLERFQKRYAVNLKKQKKTERKNKEKEVPFYRRGAFLKIAGFVLLFVIGIICTGQTTKAVKNGELTFFQILSEDDGGRTMVINGGAVDVTKEDSGAIVFEVTPDKTYNYNAWEEVPGLNGEYVCIPTMKGIEVKAITATDWSEDSGQSLNVCYQVGDRELWCAIMRYPNRQLTASERYQYELALQDTVKTKEGLVIDIKQAPPGDMFGIFFAGRGSYVFSGEFSQEEFTKIMKSVEKVRFD